MKGQDWTKEELEKLQEHYGKMPNKELQEKYLPNRTTSAIMSKANTLRIVATSNQPWNDEEDNTIRKHYSTMPVAELWKKYLPYRSKGAILARAHHLGVTAAKSPSWNDKEDNTIQKYYGIMPVEEFHDKYLPNRNLRAIKRRAHDLGITPPKSPPWTEVEENIMRRYYGKMPNKELQEQYLPNRSEHSIRRKASELHITSKRSSAGANEEKDVDLDPANFTVVLLPNIYSSTPFPNWLAQNIRLPESSIVAYSNAIGAISKEMNQKGTIRKPLENMSPFELDLALSLIISDAGFTTKDIHEKQMCRNALKQYRYFLNTTAEDSGDHAYMEEIEHDRQIPETEKTAIIQSRIGQGVFRKSLIDKYNGCCIITRIDLPELLVASHIKPWAASSNEERLDVNNGLLLSATCDRLFDKGLITFSINGEILLSPLIGAENIKRLGLSQGMKVNLQINKKMEEYLSYHRDILFVEKITGI